MRMFSVCTLHTGVTMLQKWQVQQQHPIYLHLTCSRSHSFTFIYIQGLAYPVEVEQYSPDLYPFREFFLYANDASAFVKTTNQMKSKSKREQQQQQQEKNVFQKIHQRARANQTT